MDALACVLYDSGHLKIYLEEAFRFVKRCPDDAKSIQAILQTYIRTSHSPFRMQDRKFKTQYCEMLLPPGLRPRHMHPNIKPWFESISQNLSFSSPRARILTMKQSMCCITWTYLFTPTTNNYGAALLRSLEAPFQAKFLDATISELVESIYLASPILRT